MWNFGSLGFCLIWCVLVFCGFGSLVVFLFAGCGLLIWVFSGLGDFGALVLLIRIVVFAWRGAFVVFWWFVGTLVVWRFVFVFWGLLV